MSFAKISEVFVSFQGEGLFSGQRHIFVRFYGCNLKCSYCDEGKKRGRYMSDDDVIKMIEKLSISGAKVVSFTGGEPLLYSSFIKDIVKKLGKKFLYLLETNATLVDEFLKIKRFINIVSADIKLPQYCGKELWDKQIMFLKLSRDKVLYVKVVFDLDVDIDDFKKSVESVLAVSKKIPFFIQPVSKNLHNKNINSIVDKLYKLASTYLYDVRYMPQIHKLLGLK